MNALLFADWHEAAVLLIFGLTGTVLLLGWRLARDVPGSASAWLLVCGLLWFCALRGGFVLNRERMHQWSSLTCAPYMLAQTDAGVVVTSAADATRTCTFSRPVWERIVRAHPETLRQARLPVETKNR